MAFVAAPPNLIRAPPHDTSSITSLSHRTPFLGPPLQTCPKSHTKPLNNHTTRASLSPDHAPANTYMKKMGALAIKDYLTCRSVRTIIFYCEEFNDGPSRDWLLRFDHFADREKTLFRNGDQYLMNMMYAPNEKCMVTVGHPKGYFRRVYKFVIEPYRMAKRILSARVQLAEEWTQDLKLIQKENLEMSRIAIERIFVVGDEEEEEKVNGKKNRIFDEGAFKNQSPLRYKSYQNVKVLTTQHAAARLLTHLRDSCNHEYMWLLQFMRSYGAIQNGDELIECIMRHEPEVRKNPAFTVVPQRLAEKLMKLRVDVAEEWIEVLKGVPKEQLALQRHLLELSIGGGERKLKVEGLDKGLGGISGSSSSISLFDPSDN